MNDGKYIDVIAFKSGYLLYNSLKPSSNSNTDRSQRDMTNMLVIYYNLVTFILPLVIIIFTPNDHAPVKVR